MFKYLSTRQTTASLLILLSLPSLLFVHFKLNNKPNTCFRCDFNGGKKVKACPEERFETSKIEVIECGYQKPICGITLNVTADEPKIIYAGCYPRRFDRHCFKDLVRQYQSINGTFCYHTCNEFLCNPYESWLKDERSGFNLFKIFRG